jgi:hypothetical protein
MKTDAVMGLDDYGFWREESNPGVEFLKIKTPPSFAKRAKEGWGTITVF